MTDPNPTVRSHLAQLNIARLRAPLDAPELADFVAQLAPINAVADRAPGFVWRFETDAGDATALRVGDDALLLVNFSVWESVEALHAFTYRSPHAEVMARRRSWFERMEQPFLVLWWVPAGHHPDVEEALERLQRLQAEGPTPHAFTFRERFPAPGGPPLITEQPLERECPAG